MMDWIGVLLTAVVTVVTLWQLLKSEIKESEGRTEKTHGELGRKIEAVGGKVDKVKQDVAGVRENVAYIRGVMDGERNAHQPRPAAGPPEAAGPAGLTERGE